MRVFVLVIMALALTACGDNKSKQQIHDYMKSEKQKAKIYNSIQTPRAENHTTHYQAQKSRNPFILEGEIKKGGKDVILQQYAVDSMRLLGVVNKGNKTWAIISAPDGKIYKITQGDRIGNSSAFVRAIKENEIELVSGQPGSTPKVTTIHVRGNN